MGLARHLAGVMRGASASRGEGGDRGCAQVDGETLVCALEKCAECASLAIGICQPNNAAQGSFAYGRATRCLRHRQDIPLDLRRQPEQCHDLRHSSPRDPLPSGDRGLGLHLASVKLALPLQGRPE